MNKKSENLGLFNVALMYVSVIMGAGFASGREIWQFFGVFGEKGKFGVLFVGFLFIFYGIVTAYIARTLDTNDMGRIIVPWDNKFLISAMGYFMAGIIFTVMVTMTAACGTLLNQQFGLPVPIGGIILAVISLLTILGDFERISKVFRLVMPVLFVLAIVTCLLTIFSELEPTDIGEEVVPSPIAKNYIVACFLYISLNMEALIPFVATTAINAKDKKTALIGSGIGGIFLGLLVFLLMSSLQKDMMYSQAVDMPMLGFASRVSPVLGYVYMVVLFFAIYSSATSNFYGTTTKIKPGPNKKKITIILIIIAYLIGLVGFKNIIEYFFPVYGYLGLMVIVLITINFIKILINERKKKNGRD